LTTEQDHPDFHLGETKIYGLNEKWCKYGVEHGLRDDDMDALDLMRRIYQEVLKKDAYWHFFWEGDYTVIRHEVGYYRHIKHLVEQNTDDLEVVQVLDGYRENMPTTKKYLESYVHIFHGFSLLALEIEDDDFLDCLERNNHCFLNMVTRFSLRDRFKVPCDKYGTTDGMGWESIAIMMVAHLRSYTVGWLYGTSEERKKQERKREKECNAKSAAEEAATL
jgi:hypothetical protein